MPDTDSAPSTAPKRPSINVLKNANSRAYAKQAVAKTVAAAMPFRRPEGEPNCLPLPPRVERDPVADAARSAAFRARWDAMWADFTVADLIPAADAPARVGHDRMYPENPLVYYHYGQILYNNGWLSFPQRSDGNRGPEGGIEYGQWRVQYPPLSEIRSMESEFPFSNVAIMLGEVSHWSIAFDVDVMDLGICNRIRELMTEHLGPIRMQRWGQAPKFIALYRTAPETEVRAQSYALVRPAGSDDKAVLEVLGHRSVFTAYGYHHKTGGLFKWYPSHPFCHDPRELTLVTPAQINSFLHAVHKEFPFVRAPRSASRGCEHDPDDGVEYVACDLPGAYVPKLPLDGSAWTNDGSRVTGGRYFWMRRHSLSLVCGNADLVRAGQVTALADAAWPYVSETLSDRGGDVRRRYLALVKSTATKLLRGDLTEWRPVHRPDGTAVKPARHVATARATLDEALSWLGGQHPVGDGPAKARGAQRAPTIRSTPVGDNGPEACARRATERSLLRDRACVHALVRGMVADARRAWIREMETHGTRIIVSRAPTGAGKTTDVLGPETMEWLRAHPRLEGEGPILYLAPTLANLAEAAAAAGRAGAVVQDGEDDLPRLDAMAARAQAQGVRAVVWRGKGKANCARWQEMALLHEAGIPTHSLCRAEKTWQEKEEDGKDEPFVYCYNYFNCTYQRMKAEAAKADIVFLSHYWLTAGALPTELKEARAIVVDESVLFRVAQASFLPLATLDLRRPDPMLTKSEWKELRETYPGERLAAIREQRTREYVVSLQMRRSRAVATLQQAVEAGVDPATVFADHDGGLDMLDAAVRIATDGLRPHCAIYPGLTLDDVAETCSDRQPEGLRLERRLWVITRDRVKALLADREQAAHNARLRGIWARTRPGDDTAREDLRPTPTLDAEGRPRRDVRLQRIWQPGEGGGMVEGLRVSWRAEPNWQGVPTLLLDASADADIVRCMWPGRTVEVFAVPEEAAPLNLRTVLVADGTYSQSAMLPTTIRNDPEADRKRKDLAAARIAGVCKLFDLAATAHATGRVLFGASKSVRERLAKLARQWPNADEVHYGAQRGLDFAKGHLAAVSVGRSEMPIWLVDGLVAALTWDAPEPEEPYDKRGDGTVDGKKALMRLPRMRLVRMRDGRDLELVIPVMPGDMAARVDLQWREEEIQQFRGRLRPVFRDQPATWVHVSSVIPEGVVADEILTLGEAVASWSPVLATVPGMLGVVSPVETARLAGVPVAEVEAYVRDHADDPSWRLLTWQDGVETRQGLLAAWQDHHAVALGMSAITDTASVIIGDLRAPMVPSGTRAPDAVELARPSGATLAAVEKGFAAHWAVNAEGDREAARVGWIRERLDAPPQEPETPAEPEPQDDEAPAIDDIGWADDTAPLLPASWLDTSWSPDALSAG